METAQDRILWAVAYNVIRASVFWVPTPHDLAANRCPSNKWLCVKCKNRIIHPGHLECVLNQWCLGCQAEMDNSLESYK